MKKLVYFLALVAVSANAQYKLNRVTVDELKETVCKADTSAAAEILFKKTDVSFRINPDGYWNVEIDTKVKIKIYKKEGYKYANSEVTYYSGTNSDVVRFNDAATYNLVDGKVERTKLRSEGEFTEQTTKDYKTRKISLPNVREGCIVEYSVHRSTYTISYFPDYYFQYAIPVRDIEYCVVTPEMFKYNKYTGGFLTPKVVQENLTDAAGRYNSERFTYTLSNVPALADEDYVNNIDNYRARVIYELASRKKNGFMENLATDWVAVANKIYEDDDFGPQLRKDSYFEEDLTALLAGKTDKLEKTKAIFDFVQKRMAWNERRGLFCRDGVRSAYKTKTGNVAEINLMLTAMLRYAGINANPVLVSTRDNGIALFPSRTAFDYVISAVDTGTGFVLLDATSKNSQPDILPIRVLNWSGRMIRNDGSSQEIDLMPQKNSKENITIMAEIDAAGSIKGKIRDIYADYNAYRFRENYGSLSQESYLEKMEKRYKGLAVSDYAILDKSELGKPVIESYSFTHEGMVEVVGDRMYFSPLLFFARAENPFKQEKREYPVDFIYPYQDRYTINIAIPEGFIVESLPAAGAISAEDNLGSFRYQIGANGKVIQLSVVHDMNYPIVSPKYYDTLKNFYKELITKQNEKIVLKKV